MNNRNFAIYAWGVLLYNIAVIVWGAFVRATGSGAGCGEHWPLCNGQVLPRAPQLQTLIEFTHRTSSGLAGLLVAGLVVWAFRRFPKGHVVRLGAALSLFFIITEGLIGAALVKLGLVATNNSGARAVAMTTHLVNTLILMAVLALTAWWASARRGEPSHLRWSGQRGLAVALGSCLLGVVLLGASGAIIALGATLFPVKSFAEGWAQDLSPAAHFLVRLRWIHPVFAVLFSIYLVFTVIFISSLRQSRETGRLARSTVCLLIAQLVLGGINIALHAPIWVQLLHLLTADLVWISLVLFANSALAAGRVSAAGESFLEGVPQQTGF